MGDLNGLLQDLVLQGLLAQNPLELPDPLLQRTNLGARDHLLVRLDRFLTALGHEPSPAEDQAGRSTMLAGDVRNRHPRLGGLTHHHQLLLQRVPPTTLDAGKHFDSIWTDRHSRSPRLTPSS